MSGTMPCFSVTMLLSSFAVNCFVYLCAQHSCWERPRQHSLHLLCSVDSTYCWETALKLNLSLVHHEFSFQKCVHAFLSVIMDGFIFKPLPAEVTNLRSVMTEEGLRVNRERFADRYETCVTWDSNICSVGTSTLVPCLCTMST